MAMCWGITTACLAFEMVWCVYPAMHIYSIQLKSFKRCCIIFTFSCIGPLFEAFGMIYSKVAIRIESNQNELLNDWKKTKLLNSEKIDV